MKNKLFYLLKSKVRIKVTGKHPKRFVHKLVSNKIELLNIKYPSDNVVLIWIYKKDYVEVERLKTVYEASVIDAEGLIKIRKHIFINRYLIFSIILGISLLIFLTNLIFSIEVIHTNKEVRDFMIRELKLYNIKKYKFKKSYKEIEVIKKDILNKYKDKIEWLEIENVGVKYIVRIQLRELPNLKDAYGNRNVVAGKDAIIKKVIAKSGQVVKFENSHVKKGDVIISGNITLNDSVKGTVSAEGKVYGEVWYQMTVEYPFTYYEEKYTSRKRDTLVLQFLNLSIDLFPFNKFKNKKSEDKVLWQHKLLPIGLKIAKQKEFELIDQVLTEDEAIKYASDLAKSKMKKELNDDEYIISQKNLKINVNDSKIVLEVFFVVYEDITSYEEISEKLE